MNLRMIDLNLLVVFDAIAQERNATRAAARLNMTQPAISHALGRLRLALKDELFLRTPEGMEPTPFALRLAAPLRAALQDVQTLLADGPAFEPATSERSFSIAVDNRSALILAAPVAAAVAAEAPGVTLDIRPSGTLDIPDRLDRGELDIAVGSLASPGERFSDVKLFEDHFVALVRRGHPAAGDGALTAEAIGAFPHLTLSSTGEDASFVDTELATLGIHRRVRLRAPLLAAAATLVRSEVIAIVGERTARAFAQVAPLHVLPLPFMSPTIVSAMLWHRRFDDLEAHQWLRKLVIRVARTV